MVSNTVFFPTIPRCDDNTYNRKLESLTPRGVKLLYHVSLSYGYHTICYKHTRSSSLANSHRRYLIDRKLAGHRGPKPATPPVNDCMVCAPPSPISTTIGCDERFVLCTLEITD